MTDIRRKHVLGVGGALLLLTGVALHAQIPTDALSLDRGFGPGEIDHGATAPEVDLQAQVLATLELSNGSTVTFLAVPEIGELGYSELVPVDAQSVLSHGGDLRALDVFLALAPLETPVPRALIELDTREGVEKLAVGRSLTDRLVEPVYVLVDELGVEESGLRNQAGASHYCGSGSGSSFASNYCNPPVSHVSLDLIEFCDASYSGGDTVWFSLTRSSYTSAWQKREASYGRTAACGTSVQVKQLYWTGSSWVTLSTQTALSGQLISSSWHGSSVYRRVTRVRQSSSGGFRAYTNFHNDLDIIVAQ